MKKLLKKLAKKSLALTMAVMMLLTCWVWFEPVEPAHAALETHTYTLEQLYTTYLTEDPNANYVKGKFTHDNTVPAQDGLYVGVLYSPAYTNTDIYSGPAQNKGTVISQKTGGFLGIGNYKTTLDVIWHHVETTMLYDGVTAPQTGVMVTTDPNCDGGDGNSTVERVWMTNSDLAHPSYWKGICGANLDFTWAMTQGNQLNYLSTTTDSNMKISRKNADTVPVYANFMKYTGSMDDNTYLKEIKPSFSCYAYNDQANKTISATSSKYVRIINYAPLKAAIKEAKEKVVLAYENPNKYTQTSINELVKLANALVAAKPDTTYFDGSKNYYSDYAADAKAAVNAWKGFGGLKEQFLITWTNWDDSVIKSEYVEKGKTPTAPTATRPEETEYRYEFREWSPAVSAVTKAQTYKAQYNEIRKAVYITFKDVDGTIISGPTEYIIGATLNKPADPERDGSRFTGWTPAVPDVAPEVDTVYTATYQETVTVIFKDYDGTVISTQVIDKGADATAPGIPSRDPDAGYEYTFAGWYNGSTKVTDFTNIQSDLTVTAVYSKKVHDNIIKELYGDPTCTEAGYGIKYCADCDYTWDEYYSAEDFGAPLGHTFERDPATGDITGTFNDTMHDVACSDCGTEGGQLPHEWYDNGSADAVDCVTPGKTYYACDCGAEKVVDGEYGPHSFDGDVVKLDGDKHAYRCSICKDATLYGTGSTIGATEDCSGGSATCKDKAVCDICNDSYGDTLPHTFNGTPVKLDGDVHAYRCSACNDETIYGVGSTVGATEACSGGTATCKDKAVCDVCGDTHGALDPNNHVNTSSDGYVAPECGVPGFTGKVTCDDCGTVVNAGSEIPALEHKYTNYVSDGNATCTADGTKTALCDNGCGTKDTVADPGSMIDHKYTNYVYNNDAKCEVDGTETAVCDYGCGVGVDTRTAVGTALTHDYTGTAKDNTDGTHSFLCKNGCGTYGGTVDCTYGAWTSVDANTHQHTCAVCGYTPTATAHTFGAWTSNDDGTQSRTCSLCSYVDTTLCTYTSVFTKATCEDDAYTTYTCTDCGHGYTVIDKGTATGHKFDGVYKFDADADKHQQACTNEKCNAYGVGTTKDAWAECSWTYENTAAGQHKATCVCGNTETQACTGGNATCTAQAVCQFCNTAYGEKAPHSYTGTVIKLDGDKHAYLCVYCSTEGLYGVGAEKDATEDCSGGSATCVELATCEKCNDKYGTYAPHSFTGTPVALVGDVHAYRCAVCLDNTIYGVGEEVSATEACSGGSATCTDKAVCDICKDTHGELDADAHKWTDWANIAGTETHSRYCEYDNSHTQTQECFSSSPAVAAPDCNTDGFTLNTCDDCGHTWKTEPVPALGHEWGEWVANGDGTHTRTCVRECGYADNTQTEDCIKEEATFVKTAPTCTEQGYTTYTCNDCGYSWKADYIDALGHKYTEKKIDSAHFISAANCEQAALYWYDCSRCDKNAKDETDTEKYTNLQFFYGDIRKHSFVNKIDPIYLAEKATCFAGAKYYTSCKYEDCAKSSKDIDGTGTKFSDPTSRLEHVWTKVEDNLYIATKPDCVNDATYYYVCSLCGSSSKDYGDGETWTKENSKSGHAMAYTEGKAATCTEAGNYEYWYCSTCKKFYKDELGTNAFLGQSETIIKKLSHTYVYREYKAPTCTEAGHSAYSYCSTCNYVEPGYKDETYPATGHDFRGNLVCDKANNWHSRLCRNGCGVTGLVVGGEQIVYVPGVEGGEPCKFTYTTTTVDGKHTHNNTCVCGNGTVTEVAGAVESEKKVTCTEDGYTTYKCTDPTCGETWIGNIVKATGHTLDGAAVSNGNGTHSIKCSVCEYENSTEKCYGGEATCKEPAKCTVCNGYYGEKGICVYDDTKWVENTPAKCGVNATEKNVCTACGTEAIREIAGSALKHDMTGFVETTPGTCNERSVLTNSCKRDGCDYTETKRGEKDPTNHRDGIDYENDSYEVAGNCATGVTHVYTCKYCGGKELVNVASSHVYKEYAKVNATCENDGYVVIKCNQCGSKLTIDSAYPGFGGGILVDGYEGVIDTTALVSKGHQWSDVIETKAPTCSKIGRGYKVCSGCKIKVDVEITELKPHDLKLVKGYAATCTSPGRTDYYECYKCGYSENADDSHMIPAKGHTDVNGSCSTCGKELSSPSRNCNCMCHKESGFSQFIYKILRFFWKLFGMNKSCPCGTVHY